MTVAEQSQTSFDLIGGAMIVRQITDHFYDLMEADPAYAQLRDLHAEDLASMRVSLAGFLNAWLGGPGDWFVEHPGTGKGVGEGKWGSGRVVQGGGRLFK